MEKYMDRNGMEFATEALLGIELDPARLNWMAGPLFPSFTGSVLLTLDGTLPGIESLGWSGKMSEVVASSNIFKWTQPTGGHSMGIQTDPGDLYFQASLGQLHNSVCQLCSLKDSIHLLKN